MDKDAAGKAVLNDGKPVFEERGNIAEHLLTLAERRVFPIVISALTIAEVHKVKGKQKLAGDENQNVLAYFEHDFVNVINIDRGLGEEANRLCRQYEANGLSPTDAIHLACAKKAGCDVLLSWDGVLNSIKDAGIRIEHPVMWIPAEKQNPAEQTPLFLEEDSGNEKGNKPDKAAPLTLPAEVQRSNSGRAEGQAGTEKESPKTKIQGEVSLTRTPR